MTTFGEVQRSTYPVEGTTLEEAYDAITGHEEAGVADWQPAYTVDLGDDGNVTSAEVTVTLSITMPEWTGYASATPAAQAEWSRWWAALEAHEQGHITLVQQQLAGLEERLVGKSQDEAAAEFERALSELQEASDSYDAETDHGRLTGTVMNLDVEAPAEEDAELAEPVPDPF